MIPVAILGAGLLWRAGTNGQTIIRGAMIATAVTMAISGWWFVRNVNLYGEPLPLHGFESAFAGTMQAKTMALELGGWPQYAVHMVIGIFKSFWAVFGRPEDLAIGRPRFLADPI